MGKMAKKKLERRNKASALQRKERKNPAWELSVVIVRDTGGGSMFHRWRVIREGEYFFNQLAGVPECIRHSCYYQSWWGYIDAYKQTIPLVCTVDKKKRRST